MNSGDMLKIANLTGGNVNYYNLSIASNFYGLMMGRRDNYLTPTQTVNRLPVGLLGQSVQLTAGFES